MALQRSEKQEILNNIQSNLSNAKSLVVVQYKGMTVSQITALRNKARKDGVFIQVTKNTLAKKALENTPYKALQNLFSGQTAVAYSDNDEIATAKAVVSYSKENDKLVIVGGAIGEQVLDVAGVKNVALMPSLNESRAKIIGILNAPATKLVRVLSTPGGQVARVISAKSKAGA